MDWGWGWFSHTAQARGNGSYRQKHPCSIPAKGLALHRHIPCLPQMHIPSLSLWIPC